MNDDRNFVLLEGTVIGEPSLKDTANSRLLMFRVATLREGMKYPEKNSVKAWGDAAVRLSEGDRVEVRGVLKTEKWGDEDKPKFWTGVVVDDREERSGIKRIGAPSAYNSNSWETGSPQIDDDDDLPF